MTRRPRLRAIKSKEEDLRWMSQALVLASKGGVFVSPNPQVGACVVKAGRLVSSGYHARFGGPHAEVEALKKAGLKARGATLYVTLEPCSSWGKTPPCIEAILRSGISRVVIAMTDPNPVNRGKGILLLRRAGIAVTAGVLSGAAEYQNEPFSKWIKTGFPFVTLKMAQSLDGKIASSDGRSRWISGLESRAFVHSLRQQNDAVLVGMKTWMLDDPLLSGDLSGTPSAREKPWRVVIDPAMQIPSKRRVFKGNQITIQAVSRECRKNLSKKVFDEETRNILLVKEKNGRLDLRDLLKQLGSLGVTRLLVEGGGETAWSLLSANLVDKVFWVVAPKFIGGRDAVTSVEGDGFLDPNKALNIKSLSCRRMGSDWLFEGRV